jgi:hypothetical protein
LLRRKNQSDGAVGSNPPRGWQSKQRPLLLNANPLIFGNQDKRERISLGIKQIEKDPFSAYLAQHEKGSIVKGTVLKIEPQGITDNLAAGGGGLYPNVGIIA